MTQESGNKLKLSSKQREVIEYMYNGWELWSRRGMITATKSGVIKFWLQCGGCGKGGPVKRVASSTFDKLFNAKLIEVIKTSPGKPTIFSLTEKANSITSPSQNNMV